MKYLYYSLYLFYVKIIFIHKQYPPIINITAVMALLISFFVFSIINAHYHDLGLLVPTYIYISHGIFYLLLWQILYKYYMPRENKLLDEIKAKPIWFKVVICVVSLLIVILLVKSWMFNGMSDLYQYLKTSNL